MRFRCRRFLGFGGGFGRTKSVGVAEHEEEGNRRQHHDYRGGEEEFEGRGGLSRVVRVEGIYAHNLCYGDTQHHGNEHRENHSHALESAFRTLGDVILEGGSQRSAEGKHCPEKNYASDYENGQICVLRHKFHTVHDYCADYQYCEQGEVEPFSAHLVEEYAQHAGYHRAYHDNCSERQNVIGYAESVCDKVDEVRHKCLLSDAEQTNHREGDIHHLVGFDYRRTETVEGLFEVIGVGVFDDVRRVFHSERAHHAAYHREYADYDEEKFDEEGIAVGDCHLDYFARFVDHGCPVVVGKHPDSEHQHRGDDGHNGKYCVDLAAVGGIGDIGDPGVERCVVGGGAEESHHAVEYYEHGDDTPVFACRKVYGYCGEKHYRHAPDYVAEGDEGLALTRLVDQAARKNRRYGCGQRRQYDHQGGDGVIKFPLRVEKILPEFGEEHIFDHPRNLSDEPEEHGAEPDFFPEGSGLCLCSGGNGGIFHNAPPYPLNFSKAQNRCQYGRAARPRVRPSTKSRDAWARREVVKGEKRCGRRCAGRVRECASGSKTDEIRSKFYFFIPRKTKIAPFRSKIFMKTLFFRFAYSTFRA